MKFFVDPMILYAGLATAFGLIVLYWQSQKVRSRRIRTLISGKLISKLIPSWSPGLQYFKAGLIVISVLLLFAALARPQWGTLQKKMNPTGIDVLIALDVSKSMLARDVRPNRLERVKLGINNLLDRVRGDRLGLVAFSGTAFLQCPLTLDHQAFSKTLKDLEVGIIKAQGTNLAAPIEEASRSFSSQDRDRFLILLSDGEDLEGQGLKRAKQAKEEGIRIFTIGIGSPDGARIPMDPLGQPAQNFLKNPEGKTVISQMDEKSLRDIAETTGGRYYSLGPTGEGLARVLEHLQAVGHQKKREQWSTELPIDRYQPFVIIALIFLLVEMLTSSGKRTLANAGRTSIVLLVLFFSGCLKQDNVKRAEEAMESGDPESAARLYMAEINASGETDPDPRLLLNAGIAHLEAGALDKAAATLNQALDASIDNPKLQSTCLNALGNISYLRANQWLDQRNVVEARKAWELALQSYESAALLDGNAKAGRNLESLKNQLEERIKAMLCLISGRIWRDRNGDGTIQKGEPGLPGFVYWDRDGNGERNETSEPMVKTDEKGRFAFEWISREYPVEIRLGSKLIDSNQSRGEAMMPIFAPPPPPENPSLVKNHYLLVERAGKIDLPLPYRAAPVLRGSVWNDANADGARQESEKGSSQAMLFLDQNGNFQFDENETSFKPRQDGSFAHVVAPGQYSLSVKPDNPDANVTFPIEQRKAYLAWVDFESSSENLDFGLKEPEQQQDGSPEPQEEQSQANDPSSKNEDSKEEGDGAEPLPQEVNALYERLLQEMESKSEPLEQEIRMIGSRPAGRDY